MQDHEAREPKLQDYYEPSDEMKRYMDIGTDGEIYLKAKEVATALGYSNPEYAIWELVWSKNTFEWCVIQRAVNSNNLGRAVNSNPLDFHPQTLFLTEPGVYQLIFRSHLPFAGAFQAWVLSCIRKEPRMN